MTTIKNLQIRMMINVTPTNRHLMRPDINKSMSFTLFFSYGMTFSSNTIHDSIHTTKFLMHNLNK